MIGVVLALQPPSQFKLCLDVTEAKDHETKHRPPHLHAVPRKSRNLEEKSNAENIDLKSNSFKGEFK